ncbi:MAG: NfeD family protein [Clostridia bacterium]
MWQIWLILAGLFLVLEIFTAGFLIFWLSIGSLFAMIVSFFTDNIIVQTAVFVVSSTILIFATKPFVKKFAQNKSSIKTNVYSIVGKTGLVIEEINPIQSTGQIKINGETWSASTKNNIIIPEGSEVEVLEIKGVKTIVAPIQIVSKNN